MLDRLRKAAGGWTAQLLIALLVVAFALWGVSGFFTGFYADVVATVGRTDVTIREFQRNYDFALRQLGQQLGQSVTPEQAQLFGIPQQVLGRLIGNAAMTDDARRMGLGISSEALAKEIAADPAFRGADGTFNRDRFVNLLRDAGLTEDQYIEELRAGYVRQQLIDGLVGEMAVPQAFMRAVSEYRNEARNLAWVVLAAESAGAVPEPSEAELATWFEAHRSDFRAPELRAANIMVLAPADVAKPDEVSDADAREVYDRVVASRFTTPERRQVQQIVFDSSAEAEAAAAALAEGATFEAVLADRNLKPEDIDLGLIRRDEIIDPKVAEAAFSLALNTVSAVIPGDFGPVILRVTAIEPETVKPFEAVKDELKQEIAERRASEEVADLVNVIEDARAGGATLAEVAQSYGLSLRTVPSVDATGKDDAGVAIADLPGGAALVDAIFESDVGLDNNPLPVDKGYVWYEVTAVSAARDRELAEVRDRVLAAWKAAEIDKRLSARAEEIRDRLANGEAVGAVAAAFGLAVETAEGVTRVGEPPEGLNAAAVQAAFGGPKGHAAIVDGEGDAKIVVVASEVTVPPFFSGAPDLAGAEEQYAEEIASDLMSQYVFQVQQELGVTVNQNALQTIVAGPTQPGL
jgi:peptidyl-prolyl cis-trans isomerase D